MMTDLQSARAWLKGRRPQSAVGAAPDDRICEWHHGRALVVASSGIELVYAFFPADVVLGMHCLRCGALVTVSGLASALELSAMRQRRRAELAAERARDALERIPETCMREGCDKPVRAVVVARKDGWGRARRYCSPKCREKVKSQRATAKRRAHAKAQAEGGRDVNRPQ